MKIEINNIEKSYNNVKVLQNFTCTLNGGDIIGLVGANGAGKSTLLKNISGLLTPDLGEISYHDLKQNEVVYISERPDLFPLLTVKEHFKFIAIANGINNWQDTAEELMNKLNINEKHDSFGYELSKGMKQKSMLALSLLQNPKVVLFDEPFSGLDPQSVKELSDIILKFKKKDRIIVISSHNLNIIHRLSDEILMINEGQLLRYQSIEDTITEMKDKGCLSLEELFLEVILSATN